MFLSIWSVLIFIIVMQYVACLGCQRALLHFLWGTLANQPVCFLCSLVCACMNRDGFTGFVVLEWACCAARRSVGMCVCVCVCVGGCACVSVCLCARVWLIKQ